MPDVNSLPSPRRSLSNSPVQRRVGPPVNPDAVARGGSPSRSSSVSLAAAATINAGIHHDSHHSSSSSSRDRASPQMRQHQRRRSSVLRSLSLNDPTLPSPGELSSSDRRTSGHYFGVSSPQSPTMGPNHRRAPSLGEIHQELEQEQEAQVNRLLQMIRQQQAQLQQVQQVSGGSPSAIIEDNGSPPERSTPFPSVSTSINANSSHSPSITPHAPLNSTAIPSHSSSLRGLSDDLSRRDSRRSRHSSRTESPALRPLSNSFSIEGGDWNSQNGANAGSRDEVAYYQAETATLTRENQMLRMRIKELEKQLSDAHATTPHSPIMVSNLAFPPIDTALPQLPGGQHSAETKH
ncbi:MAG: hypothetical protein M1834_007409 [Cirrosporium novae-zelandiae]|nr:MAG: hypothetical protein M1834_007409 [Cirrosporium novae-zelandiae]